MIARKLILWANSVHSIVIAIALVMLILNRIKVLPNSFFFIAIAVLVLMIFLGLFNSMFALDEKVFLNSYDDIKALEAKAKEDAETTYQYIRVIGEHEAVKLWNAVNSSPTGEKVQLIAEGKETIIKAGDVVDRFENAVKAEISRVEEDIKTDVNKVETAVKEVFEEKAANNIT